MSSAEELPSTNTLEISYPSFNLVDQLESSIPVYKAGKQ